MSDNKLVIKTLGPGIWHVIHTLAYHAHTDQLKESFISTINTLCDHFGCDPCKTHMRLFINAYPIKNYRDEQDGLFKWSWEFHNKVNQKLNKPNMSFETALQHYKNYTCQTCTAQKLTPAPFLVPVKEDIIPLHYINFISR